MSRQEIVADTMSKYWNVRDELKGMSLDELKCVQHLATLPFAVCALNVTGDLNLGIMMRTACLMGAEKFIVYGSSQFDRRSCVGAQNYIDIVKAGSTIAGTDELDYTEFLPLMTSLKYLPLFFDTDGIPLSEYKGFDDLDVLRSQYGWKPCLVFGNEGLGIPKDLMKGELVLTIPQRGVLRSLNVGAAASIAIHHFSEYLSPSSSPA